MSFDFNSWKQQLPTRLQGWRQRMGSFGINSIYATLCAASLYPVIEAMQAGQTVTAPVALAGVVAGVGGNLVANVIQNVRDEATLAQQIAAEAPQNEPLRAELDIILEKLETISHARSALPAAEQSWFQTNLLQELAKLGNLPRFQATLTGSGTVVQGNKNTILGERAVNVKGDVHGSIITGDQSGGIRAAKIEAEHVVSGLQQHGGRLTPSDELSKLVEVAKAGGITADTIKATTVVSGVQYLAVDQISSSDQLKAEVDKLQQQLTDAIAANEIPNDGDAEDAADAIEKTAAELKKPEPTGNRIVRKLGELKEILERSAEVAESAGNSGLKIIRLIPIAAGLLKAARLLFGL